MLRPYNIMMKCMLAILLSALFASCKNEIEEEADPYNKNNEKAALTFSTYTASATRATDVTLATLQGTMTSPGTGFKVSAWYGTDFYFKDSVVNGTGTKDGSMAGVEGTFDTQEETYYWPFFTDSKKMFFRAFNNLKKENPAEWADTKYETVAYSVAPNAQDQEDLVVAYAVANKVPDNGVQPLAFSHALSKINFSFAGDNNDYVYTIKKVEVIAAGKPLGKDRKPKFWIEDNEWDFTEITEITKAKPLINSTGIKQGVLYTYHSDADVVVNGTTFSNMNENFMLLPQKGKIAVRVYYKVEDKSGKLLGNCGYYETDQLANHNVMLDGNGKVVTSGGTNKYTALRGMLGYKTIIIDLVDGTPAADKPQAHKWQSGYSYRFKMTLPTDNFIGDLDGDGIADGKDDAGNDLDGDADSSESEFKYSVNSYIEFSVSFTAWSAVSNGTTITIK